MNPLLLIGLAVGGVYLLTRKSGDKASQLSNDPNARPPQSVIDDLNKIIAAPGTKEEKRALFITYMDRAKSKLTSDQLLWIEQNY